MSAAWTFDEFVDELATAVGGRSGITALNPEVRVFTYWPGPDAMVSDALVIGYAGQDDNEPAALGNQAHKETVNVECLIRVLRAGAGTTPANQARERALVILDEVSAQLRTAWPQVGVQTTSAHVSDRRIDQYPSTASSTSVRVCEVEFTIRYQARTAKT